LFGVGVGFLAVAAGALGYYFGFYRKHHNPRAKYTYKRVIVSSNTTSSEMKPLSLSSND